MRRVRHNTAVDRPQATGRRSSEYQRFSHGEQPRPSRGTFVSAVLTCSASALHVACPQRVSDTYATLYHMYACIDVCTEGPMYMYTFLCLRTIRISFEGFVLDDIKCWYEDKALGSTVQLYWLVELY